MATLRRQSLDAADVRAAVLSAGPNTTTTADTSWLADVDEPPLPPPPASAKTFGSTSLGTFHYSDREGTLLLERGHVVWRPTPTTLGARDPNLPEDGAHPDEIALALADAMGASHDGGGALSLSACSGAAIELTSSGSPVAKRAAARLNDAIRSAMDASAASSPRPAARQAGSRSSRKRRQSLVLPPRAEDVDVEDDAESAEAALARRRARNKRRQSLVLPAPGASLLDGDDDAATDAAAPDAAPCCPPPAVAAAAAPASAAVLDASLENLIVGFLAARDADDSSAHDIAHAVHAATGGYKLTPQAHEEIRGVRPAAAPLLLAHTSPAPPRQPAPATAMTKEQKRALLIAFAPHLTDMQDAKKAEARRLEDATGCAARKDQEGDFFYTRIGGPDAGATAPLREYETAYLGYVERRRAEAVVADLAPALGVDAAALGAAINLEHASVSGGRGGGPPAAAPASPASALPSPASAAPSPAAASPDAMAESPMSVKLRLAGAAPATPTPGTAAAARSPHTPTPPKSGGRRLGAALAAAHGDAAAAARPPSPSLRHRKVSPKEMPKKPFFAEAVAPASPAAPAPASPAAAPAEEEASSPASRVAAAQARHKATTEAAQKVLWTAWDAALDAFNAAVLESEAEMDREVMGLR